MQLSFYFAVLFCGMVIGYAGHKIKLVADKPAPQAVDWNKVERAYAACGDGRFRLMLTSTKVPDDAWVITWLKGVITDIEQQGWSALESTDVSLGVSCSVYAGPRVNGKLPTRPLEGDEIRKLRDLSKSIKVEPKKPISMCVDAQGNIVQC